MIRIVCKELGLTGLATLSFVVLTAMHRLAPALPFPGSLPLDQGSWVPAVALLCVALLALPFHLLRLSWVASLAALTMSAIRLLDEPALGVTSVLALGLGAALCCARVLPARARASGLWLLPPLAMALLGGWLLAGASPRLMHRVATFGLEELSLSQVVTEVYADSTWLSAIATVLPWALWTLAGVLWFQLWQQRSQRPTFWLGLGVIGFVLLPGTSQTVAHLLGLTALGWVALLEQLHGLAFEDELTGVASRRALDDALRALPTKYALALVDIDHFKKINDRHGHDAGDQVLRAVAGKLRATRGGEVFRYGGEEFALLFRRSTLEEAEEAVDTLRRQIAARSFVVRKTAKRRNPTGRLRRKAASLQSQRAVKVRISAGVASHQAGSAREVLRAADQALYRAKRAGRNRVLVARGAARAGTRRKARKAKR